MFDDCRCCSSQGDLRCGAISSPAESQGDRQQKDMKFRGSSLWFVRMRA